MARSFNALVSSGSAPALLPHDPFLHISAGTLALSLVAAKTDVTATRLTALAHARGPDTGPGGDLWAGYCLLLPPVPSLRPLQQLLYWCHGRLPLLPAIPLWF